MTKAQRKAVATRRKLEAAEHRGYTRGRAAGIDEAANFLGHLVDIYPADQTFLRWAARIWSEKMRRFVK